MHRNLWKQISHKQIIKNLLYEKGEINEYNRVNLYGSSELGGLGLLEWVVKIVLKY